MSSSSSSSSSAMAMVSMNVMLAIHGKRTVACDLKSPLKKFIRQQYSERQAIDAEEDLENLQEMRRGLEKPPSSLDARRDLLLRYFRMLTVVESRFPIGGGDKTLGQIVFTWHDAFKSVKKASQNSLAFEKAAVAFNLAATMSQAGLAADRSTAQGIKQACHAFQEAAGTFAYVKENLSTRVAMGAAVAEPGSGSTSSSGSSSSGSSGSSTVDMSAEACGMLERLMLGQAQECFFDKALADGKSAAVCARLAQQVALFYDEAHAALLLPPLSTHFDRAWVGNVQVKALLFHAEAMYRSALDLIAKEEMGMAVARLKQAKATLYDARKAGKGVIQPLMDCVIKLEALVTHSLGKAETENDKVYLMKVPDTAALPVIAAAALAAPISPKEQFDARGVKMFTGIVPDTSMRDLSRYTDMVDSLIRTQTERLQQESELAKVRLKELELPRLLMALEGNRSVWITEELRDSVEPVIVSGGLSALKAEVLQLDLMRQENERLLIGLEESLDAEAREDASVRGQFGSRWARPPSSMLTQSLRERVNSFARNLKQAGESDARISRELKDCDELLSVLNVQRVEDSLPAMSRPMVAVQGDEQAIVGSLKQLLGELEALGAQRASLEGLLREKKNKDDIMPQLMATLAAAEGPASVENLFRRELAKFDPLVADVQRNVEAQRSVMARIDAEMENFSSTFDVPNYKANVAAVVKRMEAAAAKYRELTGNVKEGLKFYVALQDAIATLRQQCTDFVMTRQLQSRELIDTLQRQLEGLSVATASTAAAGSTVTSSSAAVGSGATSMANESNVDRPNAYPSLLFSAPAGEGGHILHQQQQQQQQPGQPQQAQQGTELSKTGSGEGGRRGFLGLFGGKSRQVATPVAAAPPAAAAPVATAVPPAGAPVQPANDSGQHGYYAASTSSSGFGSAAPQQAYGAAQQLQPQQQHSQHTGYLPHQQQLQQTQLHQHAQPSPASGYFSDQAYSQGYSQAGQHHSNSQQQPHSQQPYSQPQYSQQHHPYQQQPLQTPYASGGQAYGQPAVSSTGSTQPPSSYSSGGYAVQPGMYSSHYGAQVAPPQSAATTAGPSVAAQYASYGGGSYGSAPQTAAPTQYQYGATPGHQQYGQQQQQQQQQQPQYQPQAHNPYSTYQYPSY